METDRRVPLSLLSETRRGAIVTVEGEGGEYRGRIVRIDGEEAEIRVFEELPFGSESPLHIILIQAVPKKERMELIIQKATELGAAAVFPCTSERSVAREAGGGQDKSHRWQAVARRAVEQCRRRIVPHVAPWRTFEEVVSDAAACGGLKLILYEKERGTAPYGLPQTSGRRKARKGSHSVRTRRRLHRKRGPDSNHKWFYPGKPGRTSVALRDGRPGGAFDPSARMGGYLAKRTGQRATPTPHLSFVYPRSSSIAGS